MAISEKEKKGRSMPRLFVAIDIPQQNKMEMRLFCHGPRSFSWGDYQSFHLTLCFLGELDFRDQHLVEEALEEIYVNEFTLYPQGIGCFERSGKGKHVIWVGVKKSLELEELQTKVESELIGLDVPIDRKKFVPHITIGKQKGGRKEDLHYYLGQDLSFPLSPIKVNSFYLFSSKRGPKGAHYHKEKEFKLLQ